MRRRHAVALLTLVTAGCMLGTGAGNFQPATGPAGITVELRGAHKARLTGELLEVRDTALVLLDSTKVRLAPFRAIQTAAFRHRSVLDFAGSSAPPPDQRARMRLVARFPAGLAPELLRQLLEAHGQSEESLFP